MSRYVLVKQEKCKACGGYPGRHKASCPSNHSAEARQFRKVRHMKMLILHAAGQNGLQIAEELEVAPETVYKVLRRPWLYTDGCAVTSLVASLKAVLK